LIFPDWIRYILSEIKMIDIMITDSRDRDGIISDIGVIKERSDILYYKS
jgi:hypothetical protein